MDTKLSDSRVLVTAVAGTTGFIGGRLVEKLALYHKANVRVCVEDFSEAVRAARFPVEVVQADLSDPEAASRAVAGCSVVFHCAWDAGNLPKNVAVVHTLTEACLREQVQRLVHLSSISVYEPLSAGIVDESSPAEPCGWPYADNKLAMEQEVLRYAREFGLPAAVIQPAHVYGPFAENGTLRPIRRMRTGRLVLPHDGEGLCNAVYVDDTVDALILGATRGAAIGERFLISGPAPVTWRQFYSAYEQVLGIEGVLLMPVEKIFRLTQEATLASKLALLCRDPMRALERPLARRLYELVRPFVSDALPERIRRGLPARLHLPNAAGLAVYRARARVSVEKARHLLGYEPQFDFTRGMALTAHYIRRANL